MSIKNRVVSMRDYLAAVQDNDETLDTGFMNPRFAPDWESEISDEELESIMAASDQANHRRSATVVSQNREKAIQADLKDRRKNLKLKM